MDQSRQAGFAATNAANSAPTDAANRKEGKNARAARGELLGNAENLGFADQVGSQTATAMNGWSSGAGEADSAEGTSGKDEITPPAFVDAVKKNLGFKTTAGEDKQNRGGGKGVTGTGTFAFDHGKRTFHTSAFFMADPATRGQAPTGSRQPQDSTYGDQNAHLKHKSDPSKADSGKGNAAEEPSLPSQHVSQIMQIFFDWILTGEKFQVDAAWKPTSGQQGQSRGFSSSARVAQEAREEEHTAESYFKDVDETKPPNPKVHQVDPSTTGAPVARANEQPATGEFSRAGSQTEEYDTVGIFGFTAPKVYSCSDETHTGQQTRPTV